MGDHEDLRTRNVSRILLAHSQQRFDSGSYRRFMVCSAGIDQRKSIQGLRAAPAGVEQPANHLTGGHSQVVNNCSGLPSKQNAIAAAINIPITAPMMPPLSSGERIESTLLSAPGLADETVAVPIVSGIAAGQKP